MPSQMLASKVSGFSILTTRHEFDQLMGSTEWVAFFKGFRLQLTISAPELT
jgi:hypothetical protein